MAPDTTDEGFMALALEQARRGLGRTRPNPMVGAVVVARGRVIASGFHRRAGGDHAEVAAFRRAGARARGATLYVTLEPCCHQGRTGPCTEAILAHGIRRVVVGVRDANPRVDGKGIARLRRAGVEVTVGCLESACRELNRPFFRWITSGRPLVTLKAAMTLDGFTAAADGGSMWITGPPARHRAHHLRAGHDAIVAGIGTILADDSRLTVRLGGRGRAQPLRVVLDSTLRTPLSARVLRAGGDVAIVGAEGVASKRRAAALRAAGAEVVLLPARAGRVAIADVLAWLGGRQIQSVLVEGGATVHGAFIAAGLVDRVALFVAPRLLGAGRPVAAAPVGARSLAEALQLGAIRRTSVGDDVLLEADVVDPDR